MLEILVFAADVLLVLWLCFKADKLASMQEKKNKDAWYFINTDSAISNLFLT